MKKILLIVWIILISFTAYYLYTHHVTPEILRDYFMMLGPWAFVIYILAYTVRPIVFFPASLMTPLAALLFGPIYGWALAYVGAILSATVAFLIGRYFGKKLKFTGFIQKYKEKLENNGFETVLFLRLVPLFPFDFVNYACGLSNIKYRTYLIGSLIGIIPGLTAYIFLGGSLANPYLIIPTIIAFIGLSLGARYLKKKKNNLV